MQLTTAVCSIDIFTTQPSKGNRKALSINSCCLDSNRIKVLDKYEQARAPLEVQLPLDRNENKFPNLFTLFCLTGSAFVDSGGFLDKRKPITDVLGLHRVIYKPLK